MNVIKTLAKARVHLLLDSPFFGSLSLRLVLVDASNRLATIATDGKNLFYSVNYISQLSDEVVESEFMHEILHLALEHSARKGSRLKSKWNLACDLAVDSIIVDNGMPLTPISPLLKMEEYKGMSAEKIYEKLPDLPEPKLECEKCRSSNIRIAKVIFKGLTATVTYQCKDCGHEWTVEALVGAGGCGRGKSLIDKDTIIEGTPPMLDEHPDVGEGKGEGETITINAKTLSDWKIYVAEAAQAARMQGKLPGGLEQLVTDILRPRIDWREVLRRFIVSGFKSDYVWFPPNKRHLHNGIILPSLKGEGLGDVVVAVDTSGSITDKELKQFLGEIQGILDTYEVTLHMVLCDAAFQGYEEFHQGDVLSEVKIHGRGGTSFGPAFQFVAEKGIEPRCFIYLTDLYGDFPSEAPQYPVLWCVSTEKDDQPFGERIRLEV